MQIICFHNPDEENGYLSNWYPSNFIVDGVHFSSMEQFMMYRKAICFQDECIAEQILGTKDVAEIKALGRAVKDYDDNDIYVIGGGEIYKEFLPYCDVAHITKIDYKYDADTYLENLDKNSEWHITANSEEKTYFDIVYEFVKYEKKK